MRAQRLQPRERAVLQAVTIVMVITLAYLLFIRREPWTAMIVGAVLLGSQRLYLHVRGKAHK